MKNVGAYTHIWLLSCFLLVSCKSEELTGKVECSENGVPQLKINGKVERPRMLYVSPLYYTSGKGNNETKLTSQFKDISFDCAKFYNSTDSAIFQFVAGDNPMEYYISKFEIVDKDSGEKTVDIKFDGKACDPRIAFKCDDASAKPKVELKNVVIDGEKALKVALLEKSENVKLFQVYIPNIKLGLFKNYRVNMRVRAGKNSDNLNFKYTLLDNRGGPTYVQYAPMGKSYVKSQVKFAKESGNVDIITFPVRAMDFYLKEGQKPDYSLMDSALKDITSANPNAKIIIRALMYPSEIWLAENPDDTQTFADGTKSRKFPSISSEKYRQESQKALSMIIDFAEKHYGKNMLGYHIGGGNSAEWFYGDSWGRNWQGYDKSTEKAWVNWLKKTYKNDQALQKAWNNPSAKIAEQKVPTVAEREEPNFLINPKTQKKIADFNQFWNDEMVDTVSCLAKVVREKVPNKLSVFFYGYAGEFSLMYNGVSYSGHLGLGKFLKNKDVDMLTGPISYFDRNFGGGKTTMGATESVSRAGKIWTDEDDTSTYLAPKTSKYPGMEPEINNIEKTLDILSRNMAQEAIRNTGSWWMDLTGAGWFNDPNMWQQNAKFDKMERDMLANPVLYNPEIALVFDETSGMYGAARGTSRLMTLEFRVARGSLNRIGTPFGHYLLDDLLFGKSTNSKLDIYAVAYALDAKKRNAIKERAKKNASVFVWAAGYIDLDKSEFSLEAMKDLTGFEFEDIQDGKIQAVAVPTNEGKKIGITKPFGIGDEGYFPTPLLAPKLQEGDVVFATYKNGKPALVLRGKTLFCGTSKIPYQMYKKMAEIAGVKTYTNSPAAVYKNGNYILITPTEFADKEHRTVEINTYSDKDVFDAITGEKLGKGPLLKFEMQKGQNKILRLGN